MPQYRTPRCVALDDDDRECGVEMKVLGERHPSFGPSYRPGHVVMQCQRCGAVRAISLETPEKYAARVR